MREACKQHSCLVSMWFLCKVFVRYCSMFFEPVSGLEGGKLLCQATICVFPLLPELRYGRKVFYSFIGAGEEWFIEVGVLSFAKVEQWQHTVVNGGKVAEQVDAPVF